MRNRDVFVKDPISRRLPNNGVANVNDAVTAEDLDVLRFELDTFVCDGKYADGLSRILDSFLQHVDASQQQGVWVSGFFGSGKSHLVKMLRAFWGNTLFPDGASARGVAELPQRIRDQLKELSVVAKRHGGLHAVSGTLGAGASTSVRLALLQLIFKSVGLPSFYSAARFVMKLKKDGIFDAVKSHVEQNGYEWEEELDNFYVAEGLHQALTTIKPHVYPTVSSCVETFNNLYPNKEDVSNEEMVKTIKDAVTMNGKMPLTLIVLDEVQQFIGSNEQRSLEVQEMVESISKYVGGKVMFIGTGQTAITGTSYLKKLEGRFTVRVELSEADVEGVIRKVILAKKPETKPAIETVIEKNRGEISKHLSGTSMAHRSSDQNIFAADYPILPTRRRFWEHALRVLDQTGTDSQLRNQLSMILKVIQKYANYPLGHMVPADYLYFDAADKLRQAHIVPTNIYNTIQKWINGNEDDQLRARSCALIFLINKIAGKQNDAGIYATVDTLTDLLVEDLERGSAPIKAKLSKILDETKLVMKVEHSYRLQTEESAAWDDDFQNQLHVLTSEPYRVESARHETIKKRVTNELRSLSLVQGLTKVPRDLSLYFEELPKNTEGKLSLWVQHGLQVEEQTVQSEARQAGAESSMIFVYLPAKSRDALNKAVREELAAKMVLDQRGMPMSSDAQEARSAMDTIFHEARQVIDHLLDEMISSARVFMGGGHEIQASSLLGSIKEAAEAAMHRLYPKFSIGDTPGWDKVYSDAQKGAHDALKQVGHTGEIDQHPVCKLVLSAITGTKKGSEIRSLYEGPPYGWSRDTIDGALQVLLVSGKLRVHIGNATFDPRDLSRKDIGKAEFIQESIVITHKDRIELRKLYLKAGVQSDVQGVATHAKEFLHIIESLAFNAGGEPPSPKKPDTTLLDELRRVSGNAQLQAFLLHKETLKEYIRTWKTQAEQVEHILPEWKRLTSLAGFAEDIPGTEEIFSQIKYIQENRKLISEKNIITSYINSLTQILRTKIDELKQDYNQEYEKRMKMLENDASWKKLSPEDRYEVLNVHQLRLEQQPKMDLSTTDTLLVSLQKISISSLMDRLAALPTRFEHAREEAVKHAQPQARWVTIDKPQINTVEEADQWLKQLKETVESALGEGPVLIR